METTFVIFKPGQPIEAGCTDLPAEPGFNAIRGLVAPLIGTNNIEHVTVLYLGKRADMFVDETGALKPLLRNDDATAIYRANWLKQHPDTDPDTLPAIYGPAVLFERQIWF